MRLKGRKLCKAVLERRHNSIFNILIHSHHATKPQIRVAIWSLSPEDAFHCMILL